MRSEETKVYFEDSKSNQIQAIDHYRSGYISIWNRIFLLLFFSLSLYSRYKCLFLSQKGLKAANRLTESYSQTQYSLAGSKANHCQSWLAVRPTLLSAPIDQRSSDDERTLCPIVWAFCDCLAYYYKWCTSGIRILANIFKKKNNSIVS